MEEPEALLAERERQRAVAVGARHGFGDGGDGRRLPGEEGGQPGRRGGLEQGAQGEVHPEGLAHPRGDPRGEQRVAAQVPEAVVRPDRRPAEDVREDGGERRDLPPAAAGRRAERGSEREQSRLGRGLPHGEGRGRELPERPVRIGEGGGEQRLQIRQQTARRRLLPQGAVELQVCGERTPERLRRLDLQEEVEQGRAGRHRDGGRRQAGERQRLARGVLQGEQGLDERLAPGPPRRRELLDQPVERQLLVGVGGGHGVAHLHQQRAEARRRGEVGAQHEGVDEEADHLLRLHPGAAGDRGGEGDVVPAGEAPEEDGIGGGEDHEEGPPLAPRERLHALGELRGEGERPAHAARGADRIRMIDRQRERREVGQPSPPVVEIGVELPPGQARLLPGREVGILAARRGQGRRPAGREGGVERPQLAGEDGVRPAVHRRVVDGQEQEVRARARRGKPRQGGAQQRWAGKVERAARLGGGEPQSRRLGAGAGQGGEIDERQRQRRRRQDRLDRLAVGAGDDRRAQHGVAAHHLGEGGGQGPDLEGTGEPQRQRQVGGGAPRVELLRQPHPPLGGGEGGRAVAGPPGDARLDRRGRRRLRRLDRRGHAAQGRIVEQGGERELDREGGAHPRQEPPGEQRMPPQVEEAVLQPHPRHLQHLLPDRRKVQLDLRARRGRRVRGGPDVEAQEGPAVDLAARRQRQFRAEREVGGDHEGWQTSAQEGAQILDQIARASRRRQPRHHGGEEARPRGLMAGSDRGPQHRRMRGERRLDLPQLDPVPPHLDLAVAPAEELDLAVGAESPEIAAAIEPGSRRGPGRVGQETLGGRVRAAEVAAADHGSAEIDLAHHTHRHRPQPGVEDRGAGAGDGAADGGQARPAGGGSGELEGGGDVRLGRPVVVDQGAAGQAREQRGDRRGHPQLLAGRRDLRQRRRTVRCGGRLGEQIERHERHEQPLDPLLGEQPPELWAIGALLLGQEDQRAAGAQGGEDLLQADVEAPGGELERPPRPAGHPRRELPGDQVAQHAMGTGDPLGTAGRARGVEDVGEGLGRDPHGRGAAARGGAPLGGMVEQHGRRSAGEPGGQPPPGDQDRRPRLLQHEGQAFPRVGGVERQAAAAGCEDGEEPHHGVERSPGAEGDRDVRADPQGPQAPRQAARPRRQLAVGERRPPFARRDHGHRLRRGRRLGREQLVRQGAVPCSRRSLRPGSDLRRLGRGEEGERRERPVSALEGCRHPGEEGGEMALQALERRRFVTAARVEQGDGEVGALRAGHGEERQGVVGAVDRPQPLDAAAPAPQQLAEGEVLEGDQTLEQRPLAGDRAPAADRRQRRRLALADVEQPLLGAVEPGGERLGGGEVDAHRQGVGEQADHRLDARQRRGAPGHHAAEDDVLVAAVEAEEERPGGVHERRRRPSPGAAEERCDGIDRQGEAPLAEAVLLDSSPAAGRPLDPQGGRRGETREEGLPEAAVRRGVARQQPGDVGTEGGAPRQCRRRAAGEGLVGGEDVFQNESHRPAVEQQVVVGPQELPALRRAPEQREPLERRPRRIEAAAEIGGQPVGEPLLLLARGERAPVLLVPLQRAPAPHHLDRLLSGRKGGPQDRMVLDGEGPRPCEGVAVETAGEDPGDLLEIGVRLRRFPVVEEDPFLGRGERVDVLDRRVGLPAVRERRQRGGLASCRGRRSRHSDLGEPGDRRVLEELARGDGKPAFARPGDHL